MKTFKAFDKNLKCRGYQFEVGKTYTHDGEVEACKSGFHSCENPLDVLTYYSLTESRFCVVEVAGDIKTHEDDSKIASAKITINEELTLQDYINSCVNYLISKCIKEGSKLAASGDNSNLAASGYNSNLAASGDNSKLAASGYCSIACNVGTGGKVKCGQNGAMSLSYFDKKDKRYRIIVAYVGEDGIKSDTWYMLDENHKFTECQ